MLPINTDFVGFIQIGSGRKGSPRTQQVPQFVVSAREAGGGRKRLKEPF